MHTRRVPCFTPRSLAKKLTGPQQPLHVHGPAPASSLRLRRTVCKGSQFSSDSNFSLDKYAADSACKTIERLFDVVKSRELNSLVHFMPDAAVREAAVAKSDSSEPSVDFKDIVNAMLLNYPRNQCWDSFAFRNLVLSVPASCTTLSALLVHEGKYIHRSAVVSSTGEECILTFSLEGRFDKVDASLPSDNISSAPASGTANSYATMSWQLSSVRGEALHTVFPDDPSPEFPPESIITAQLEALRHYELSCVFRHLSPNARDQVGGMEGLTAGLRNARSPYSLLLGHHRASCIRRCQSSSGTLLALVRVEGHAGTAVFCWVVQRQQSPGSAFHHCWMTEMVVRVADSNLAALLRDQAVYPDIDDSFRG